MDSQSVIIEIRSGTGGDEAALFVADLFSAYLKYAQLKDWKVKTLESSQTPLGGFSFVSFNVKGENAYKALKNEGGVHRVQRVPKTEKSGRVHTSTITVAVLKKENKKSEVTVNPSDLKIEFFRSSGPGGQNVNKRETAVRIIHLPTGTIVESQEERNQQANRERAMGILEKKISKNLEEKATSKEQESRKEQVGSGERSEKIKTYNFPQNRLTDHRIKKSWHNLDAIMDGKLDKVFSKTQKELS